jgi:hypothetical protein
MKFQPAPTAKGTETLVGMLGNVMQGFDKQVSH